MEQISWPVGLAAAYALTGILLFEYAYSASNTKKIRNVDEERDELFPAWRRVDVH